MSADADQIARVICARTVTGFCKNVGGAQGCPVGRGTSDPARCVASHAQLVLAGYSATAWEIITLIEGKP